MLSRDSEDKMWSRFVFEKVTLARWTQPSGPLCLWQFLIHGGSLFPSRSAKRLFIFSEHNSKPLGRNQYQGTTWCWNHENHEISCSPQIVDAKDRSSCRKPHGDTCGTMCFVSFVQSTFWLMSHIFVHLCCKKSIATSFFSIQFWMQTQTSVFLLVALLNYKLKEYSIEIFTTVLSSWLKLFWILNNEYVCLFLAGSETTFAQTV